MKTAFVAILALAVALLGGCAAGMVQTSRTYHSNLRAMEFNDLASALMYRPTLVTVNKMRDGSKVLEVSMQTYEGLFHSIRFYAQDTGQYIAAIDKYFDWEKIALDKGDELEKVIAAIPTPIGENDIFKFSSGNKTKHYLVLGISMNSTLNSVPGMILDHQNAVVLRKLLADLPSISTNAPSTDDYK